MSWKFLLRLAGVILTAVTMASTSVFGQSDDDPIAEKTITAYVDGIRTSNAAAVRATMAPAFSASSKTLPQYPILAKLGPVEFASIEKSFFGDTLIFKADLNHARGSSTWQFRLDQSQKLITAQLLDAEVEGPRPRRRSVARHTQPRGWGGGGRATRAPASVKDTVSCDDKPSLCSPVAGYDSRLVEFFYATDRNIVISSNKATLDTDSGRLGQLSYGVAAVRIPEAHEPGTIELPSEWRLFGVEFGSKPDDSKYFAVKRLAAIALEDWKNLVKKQTELSGENTALVFVHGFNTGFEEALFRNAQIVWDLGYKGTSVLYSWSSKGKIGDYIYDRDSADVGQPGFIALLETLRGLGIEHINVIAHSMGNRLVLNALSNNASASKPVKLDQLIMAAPDVASDQFRLQVPVVQKLAQGTTLYASSADKALIASSKLASFPRAGWVPAEGPVVLPNLDTIDVTRVGDDVLGLNHAVFASNRAVMDDLKLLLINGMKLPRLSQVRRAPEPPKPQTYWIYR